MWTKREALQAEPGSLYPILRIEMKSRWLMAEPCLVLVRVDQGGPCWREHWPDTSEAADLMETFPRAGATDEECCLWVTIYMDHRRVFCCVVPLELKALIEQLQQQGEYPLD